VIDFNQPTDPTQSAGESNASQTDPATSPTSGPASVAPAPSPAPETPAAEPTLGELKKILERIEGTLARIEAKIGG